MATAAAPAAGAPALRAEPVLISAAVNTHSQCLAWTHPASAEDHQQPQQHDLECVVAYGAHHWVALATAGGEVRHALRGHAGAVQCVQWVTPGREVASGSADGTVRVWARQEQAEGGEGPWRCAAVLSPPSPPQQQQQRLPVTRLAVLRAGAGVGVFLAATTSGGVTLWHRRRQQQQQQQQQQGDGADGSPWEVAFGAAMPPVQIPTALALVPLGRVAWALLVGAVDARIHVWTGAFAAAQEGLEGPAMEWRRAGALVGHQGWIRSLAWRPLVAAARNGEQEEGVWVASGAQDGKIRLWKVEPLGEEASAPVVAAGDGAGDSGGQEGDEDEEGGGAADEEEDDHEVRLVLEPPSAKQQQQQQQQRRRYGVRLDALLVGHEDWVTGVCWHPPRGPGGEQPLALLSCSMDRSLIIWRPEGARGVWTPRVRLGDLGADLGGAVGSNLLGFLGCAFDALGATVLGYGFGGSMHAYRLEGEEGDGGYGQWRPVPFATGHFDEVSDVQWERWRGEAVEGTGQGLGRYLVSASKDQTTRLWAPVAASGSWSRGRWHEASRVQVHGYDLACVDLLPHAAYRLVSGADEKTLRVFDATATVLALLRDLCGLPFPTTAAGGGRVETAYMQALALSTKAVIAPATADGGDEAREAGPPEEDGEGGEDAAALHRARARVSWTGRGPPLEGELVDHTLWPEVAKLYGHGNGLTCLAADHGGRRVASACKARDPETARVRLWDTATWRAPADGAAALPGHQSTVVQLAFSHDDAVLASVSKDRQVCLYARGGDGSGGYRLAQTLPKAHKRIVWSCAWSHDDALLATGSRDGTFKLWRRAGPPQQQQQENGTTAPQPILASEPLATLRPAAAGGGGGGGGGGSGAGSGGGTDSVTAVAFAPRAGADGRHMVAVGLDSGDVELWAGARDDGASWSCLLRFGGSLPHAATVKRLRWRPAAAAQPGTLELASCGSDHAVKVARVVGV